MPTALKGTTALFPVAPTAVKVSGYRTTVSTSSGRAKMFSLGEFSTVWNGTRTVRPLRVSSRKVS